MLKNLKSLFCSTFFGNLSESSVLLILWQLFLIFPFPLIFHFHKALYSYFSDVMISMRILDDKKKRRLDLEQNTASSFSKGSSAESKTLRKHFQKVWMDVLWTMVWKEYFFIRGPRGKNGYFLHTKQLCSYSPFAHDIIATMLKEFDKRFFNEFLVKSSNVATIGFVMLLNSKWLETKNWQTFAIDVAKF